MADIVRLFPLVRNTDVDRSEFSGHTGTVYKLPIEAEDGSFQMNIYVSPDAVTTSNFGAMKDGEILIDLSTTPRNIYMKEGDTAGDNFTQITTTS